MPAENDLASRRLATRGLRRLARLAVLLVGTHGLVGCATSRVEHPYVPDGVATGARVVPTGDPFPYERGAVRVSNHVEGTRGAYVLRRLTFPSTGDNGQPGNVVTAQYFERSEGERSPLVLVLPIWGGSAYPPAVVAADLVAQGQVNVMRILGDDTMIDWGMLGRAQDAEAFRGAFRQMVKRMQDSIVDLRRLLDWAERRPPVDGNRVGLVGFSESTLQAAGLMASDPRVAAAVLVMGGAHPHQILTECYGPPAAVREEVTSRLGWDRGRYAAALAPLMRPVDPAYLGSRLSPDRILLFEAERDDCVPASARETLWRATGEPTRVTVGSTHAGSFLGMTFLGGNHIRHRIREFLTQTLR